MAEEDASAKMRSAVSMEENGLWALRPALVIGSFMLLAMLEGMWESMIAPIWPVEAQLLGVGDVEEHAVFSCFQAAVLFASPVFGFYGQRLGRQRLVYLGITILCAMSFLFGSFSLYPIIFASRFFAGIGSAAMWSSGFSLIAIYFPINQSTVMGCVETAMGLGFMLGSPVGVFLYHVMGAPTFWLPFTVVGALFGISLLLLTTTLPKSSVVDSLADQVAPENDPLRDQTDNITASIRVGRLSVNSGPDAVVTQSVRKTTMPLPSGAMKASGLHQTLDRTNRTTMRASKLADAGVTLNPPLRRSHWATGSAIGAGVGRLTTEHRAVVKAIAPEEEAHGSWGWINPTTILTLFSAFMIQTAWSSFQSNMQAFLSRNTGDPTDFALGPTEVALILTAGAAMYGICAPISGRMTAKFGEAGVMSLGCVLSGFGLVLLGPIPFIDTSFDTSLHMGVLIFAVCILTTGVGMVYVPALSRLLISIRYLGEEEADRLTGVVSGVFYASSTLGGALGPMLSLVLEKQFGLAWVLGVTGFIMLALAPLNMMLNENHTEKHMETIKKVGDDIRQSLGLRQSTAFQELGQALNHANLASVAESPESGTRSWS